MNRILLEQMLQKMRNFLKAGKNIGDLKIGALYALGNQLDAVYYFVGHELGSTMESGREIIHDTNVLIETLKEFSKKYHLGNMIVDEYNDEHITFDLEECPTCKEIDVPTIDISQGFCSFEAGLFAGLVEKITGKHCFAQELECRLQNKSHNCKFMIVIPKE